MIYLDQRVGSGDLELPLRRLGIDVDPLLIDFADAAFFGNGDAGEGTVQVGIEIKKIRDLVASIQGGRLSEHQLPGLLRQYDSVVLLVEGLWRPGPDGVLEVPVARAWEALTLGTRRVMYREIDGYLNTLQIKCGVHVKRTATRDETAWVIADLYRWWRGKEWNQHRSHLTLQKSIAETAMLTPPALRRRIAAEFPGVGYQRSGDVAGHFRTTLEMVNADMKEWAGIKGIGKTIAARIVDAVGRE